MLLRNGAWLPDDERDAAMVGAGAKYQSHKLKAAMHYTEKRGLAIDVGAHCGLWSMQLKRLFERVVAFEPLPRHIECFKRNTRGCVLYEVVLGVGPGFVGMKVVEGLSGRSHVEGDGAFSVLSLDEFRLSPDFMKVDTEGYEYFVLRGAEETLKRCHPVLVVEQKPGHASRFGLGDEDAILYLEGLGAKRRECISGDWIMSWDDA